MIKKVLVANRTAKISLVNRVGNKAQIIVDDNQYDIDIVMVENGVYSILYNGHSYNVELIHGEGSKKYIVNTFANPYKAAELGYLDEIIYPKQTRMKLIQALELTQNKSKTNPPKKAREYPIIKGLP